MSRRRLPWLVALVVVVVGVPAVVALMGGSSDPLRDDDAANAPRDVPPSVPPAIRDAQSPGRGGRRGPRGGGGGSGGPPPHSAAFDRQMRGVSYPASITRSGRAVASEIARVLGPQVTPQQRTVFAADCRGGICSVRYRSQPRGTGTVAAEQVRLLRRLFGRTGVEEVVLYVHHAIVGRGKEERPAFIATRCRRGTDAFDWSRLRVRDFGRRCETTKQAGGRLRNQIRRGRLSPGDASRGRGATNGGRGGAGKGPSAPSVVDGSAKAERDAAARRAARRSGG